MSDEEWEKLISILPAKHYGKKEISYKKNNIENMDDELIDLLESSMYCTGQKLCTVDVDDRTVKTSKYIEKLFLDSDIDAKIGSDKFLEVLNYYLDGYVRFIEESSYITILSVLSLFKSGKMLKNGSIFFLTAPFGEVIHVLFTINNKKTTWRVFYNYKEYNKYKKREGVEGFKELFYDIFYILDNYKKKNYIIE